MSPHPAPQAPPERHVIGTFLADLSVTGTGGPLGTPDRLAQQVRTELLPALEEVFSHPSVADCDVRIDTLEINLGSWPEEPDWPQVRAVFRAQLLAALRPFLGRSGLFSGFSAADPMPVTADAAGTAQFASDQPSLDDAASPSGDVVPLRTGHATATRADRLALTDRIFARPSEAPLHALKSTLSQHPELFDRSVEALLERAEADKNTDARRHIQTLQTALTSIFEAAGHPAGTARQWASTLVARLLIQPDTAKAAQARSDAHPSRSTASRASAPPGRAPRSAADVSRDTAALRARWPDNPAAVLMHLNRQDPGALMQILQDLMPAADPVFHAALDGLTAEAANPRAALITVLRSVLNADPIDLGIARAAAEAAPDAQPDPQNRRTSTQASTTMAEPAPQPDHAPDLAATEAWATVLSLLAVPATGRDEARSAHGHQRPAQGQRAPQAEPSQTPAVSEQPPTRSSDRSERTPPPDVQTGAATGSLQQQPADASSPDGTECTRRPNGPERKPPPDVQTGAASGSPRHQPADASPPDRPERTPPPDLRTEIATGSPRHQPADASPPDGPERTPLPDLRTEAASGSHQQQSTDASPPEHAPRHHQTPTITQDPAAPGNPRPPRAPTAEPLLAGPPSDPATTDDLHGTSLNKQGRADHATTPHRPENGPPAAAAPSDRRATLQSGDADPKEPDGAPQDGPAGVGHRSGQDDAFARTDADASANAPGSRHRIPGQSHSDAGTGSANSEPPSGEQHDPPDQIAVGAQQASVPARPLSHAKQSPSADPRDRGRIPDQTDTTREKGGPLIPDAQTSAEQPRPPPDSSSPDTQSDGTEPAPRSGPADTDRSSAPAPGHPSAATGLNMQDQFQTHADDSAPADLPPPGPSGPPMAPGASGGDPATTPGGNQPGLTAIADATFGTTAPMVTAALDLIWSALPEHRNARQSTATGDHAPGIDPARTDGAATGVPLTAAGFLPALIAEIGPTGAGLSDVLRHVLKRIEPDAEDRRDLVRLLIARLGYGARAQSAAVRHQVLSSLTEILADTAEPISLPATAPQEGTHRLLTHYAGLVLFHPFYSLLLSRLDLLDPQQGLRRDRLGGAIAALAALGGQDDPTQPVDPLARILLGIPQGIATPPPEPLTPEHAQLVDGLIRSVIARWARLGQTSPAGLRDAFIRRGGQLRFDETGAHLQVDPGAFDVLLDGLPWPLDTMIALPWMPQPCHVTWRAQDG